MWCVGTRAHDALLHALEEAVRDNNLSRLDELFRESGAGAEEINARHLLHQAAWLGHPRCVQTLLQYGGNPNRFHKKNGCTPLHLAHFRTIEDTNPDDTIRALLGAGGAVNDRGNEKCGRLPLEHAIQYQRVTSVRSLLAHDSDVTLDAMLLAIDVSNPEILDMLLLSGAQCGPPLDALRYWGRALERVIYSPLKCPKECYKQMFQMVVQGTVCQPAPGAVCDKKTLGNIENELRIVAKDSGELARYLYALLLRTGLVPSEPVRKFIRSVGGEPDWADTYLTSAVSLKDLCVRVLRVRLYLSGNITYGVSRLKLPQYVRNHILLINPF